MGGLSFEIAPRAPTVAPERSDVACFVGFVARRQVGPTPSPAPPSIVSWLTAQGYAVSGPTDPLANVPVPIEAWSTFDALFAWESRGQVNGDVVSTYLGGAVRSFFAQGGRKCYVVRVDDPWPPSAPSAQRLAQLAKLRLTGGEAADRATWGGVAHLFGLPDVSFVCVPDLADIVAPDPPPPLAPPAVVAGPEVFVECRPAGPAIPPDVNGWLVRAPRCDAAAYARWASAISSLVSLVRQTPLRGVQIVAAVPLPLPDTVASAGLRVSAADGDLYGFLIAIALLSAPAQKAGAARTPTESAFLQLAYPWVKTPASASLPEGVESPDAVLAGVLARGALLRGAFRTVAGQPLGDVFDTLPSLTRSELSRAATDGSTLADRVSLLGPTPAGLQVLSDVTTHPDSYAQANVNRLFSAIVRNARAVGERIAFEPSNPQTWAAVTRDLGALLDRFTVLGALTGSGPYSVRCDATTNAAADIDAGRVVAEIAFTPSLAIAELVVDLAFDQGTATTIAPGGPS